MEQAVELHRVAARCFTGIGAHRGGRLVLSLFFKAVLGIQRIFHFDSLTDPGLALLTGGRSVLSRRTLGSLVRAVSTRAVRRTLLGLIATPGNGRLAQVASEILRVVLDAGAAQNHRELLEEVEGPARLPNAEPPSDPSKAP